MDLHRKSLRFISTRSWFSWFLLTALVLFARVTSQDKAETPTPSLYCISECGTCPMICSPPPPPLLTYFPPPSPAVPRSPPTSPAAAHAPPPLYFTYPQPLPKSPASPPPPHPSTAAPPPPEKSNGAPPSGSGQPVVISGPHQYSYPYYYYYSSDASSSPSSYAPFLLLLVFLHRVLSCW